jgi:hypothetical protein
MIIYYIIRYVGDFTWMLPPFRQYGTKYFLYFLILACVSPIAVFLIYVTHIPNSQIVSVFSLLALYSLLKPTKKLKITFLVILISLIVFADLLSDIHLRLISIVAQTLILISFIYDFLLYTENKRTFNLFYFLLIMYQMTVVYKFIARILDVHHGVVLFYLTTFLEIFFGIAFTFINVNTKNFRLFKESEELSTDESHNK